MGHVWKSTGDKRTLVYPYKPSPEVLTYLQDMQQALRQALQVGYRVAIQSPQQQIPSAIDLRKHLKEWYDQHVEYAAHHINPLCKAAVGLLRSYCKNHAGRLGLPLVHKLSMRLDAELVKVVSDHIRVTLQPYHYT